MGWQLSRGLGGNFAVDSVATFLRIRWQNSVEYAPQGSDFGHEELLLRINNSSIEVFSFLNNNRS
jgi:hypothetical protein